MDACYSPSSQDIQRGAYLLLEPHRGLADCAIIFREEDAALIKKAALTLSVQGIAARLIAVRDYALFEQQSAEYRHMLLRPGLPLFAAVPEGCPWADKPGAAVFPLIDSAQAAKCISSALSAQ